MQLFTVGHSNHSIGQFIELLKQHQVSALADVRSQPYSRRLPHFNQAFLKTALLDASIQYVFLGQELGARASDASCYVAGKAIYEKIAASAAFGRGIERILDGAQRYTIALMCAEQDPLTCHRAVLICQTLRHHDLDIHHILKNGSLESHVQLEDRMLARHGLAGGEQLSLFESRSREDCLKEAYQKQGAEIAYVEKSDSLYASVG